ncbi:hypothetical protein C5C07_20275, partial [Haloferax sp. Atlit-4N]|uniref:hypothetical protein n=1 Tax=Haloferax sp. Atlit-4N TaxID=2077206 RepID=UPI000E39022A
MRFKKSLSIFAALALVMSVFAGGAFAATPSIDTTNDADSTTTSDWTDGHTVAGFEANASNYSYVEASFDTALDGKAKLEVLDPDTGDKVADMESVYTNSSAQTVNETSFNYAWNIS